MIGLIVRMAIVALSLYAAASLVPGVVIEGTRTLILAALLLGVVNAVIRPVLVFLTFPITFLTLGLFLWVINAAMLGLVAALLDDMTIAGVGSALLGALVVSVVSWLTSQFIGPSGRYEVMVLRTERRED